LALGLKDRLHEQSTTKHYLSRYSISTKSHHKGNEKAKGENQKKVPLSTWKERGHIPKTDSGNFPKELFPDNAC